MRRDPQAMAERAFDVIVVGGGIYGACAAWEAALLGLDVALIEAVDFGHATSSNSLRTLHGGLRHLQRLDLVRMRESIRERREWLRLAPELAQPLKFVLPLSGKLARAPTVMGAALWANDLVSIDRNRGVRKDRRLGGGTLLGQAAFQQAFPGLALPECNGAAAWYDAICLNTERLQLASVQAAVAAGASVANYMRATRLLVDASAVCGVRARDEITGQELELHAGAVINAAGPWVDEWIGRVSGQQLDRRFHASKAFNLLTRPLPFRDGLGLSVPSRGRGRARPDEGPSTYFVIPWNGYSLIGTRHLRCEHSSRQPRVTAEDVTDFLTDLNSVLGEHRLSATDVKGVFAGLLPEEAENTEPHVALERAPQIVDHSAEGVRGLVSVVGVKWTTARAVGERAARLVARQHQQKRSGRRGVAFRATLGPTPEILLPLLREDATLDGRVVADMPIALAQVLHATRTEMAMRLSDVVRRRMPLYLSEHLDRYALQSCALVMARELRWSRREISAQIEQVEAELDAFRGPLAPARAAAIGTGSGVADSRPNNLGRMVHASAN